ncbi:hypothetical protein ABC733_06755 [Mangrovibacter sp. SLW1]
MDAQDATVTKYINDRPELFDLSNIVTMSDSGLSAFSGKNLSEGALGAFVKDVEEGRLSLAAVLLSVTHLIGYQGKTLDWFKAHINTDWCGYRNP